MCSSQYIRLRPDLAPVQARIARRLLDLGADPNARYPWPDDPSQQLSVLYACLCVAGNLPLAGMLLEAGADPNDGECAYHATEMETLDGLRLLLRHDLRLAGTNALFRMLDFDNYEGAELLLAHGADPDEGPGHAGNALRHAIRRGRDGRFADLLIAHGAGTRAADGRRSAYALAMVYGNRSMMEALERHGLGTGLEPADRFLAAVGAGRRREALELWAADPGIVSKLTRFDQRLHIAFAAQAGRLESLELMNEVGFDPDATDSEGMTALHMAAWHGHADHVRFYLSLGPDPSFRNRYGGTALGAALHGSENCPAREAGDHVGTVRLLLEAGYEVEPGLASLGNDAAALVEEWAADGDGAPGQLSG